MIELIEAVQENDIKTVKRILKTHPQHINRHDNYGRNAILYAVIYKMDYIFEILLANGGCVNSIDSDNGKSCLHYAAENGNLYICKKIVENGAELSLHDNMRHTPLHSAINLDNVKIAEYLIKSGADINNKGLNGATPLHYAAQLGSQSLLSLLIQYGSVINTYDQKLHTPFHYACMFGHTVVAYLLIKSGAHIHKTNIEGYDAIQIAALYNQEEIVAFLLDIGYPVNNIASNNNSSLHCAIRSANPAIVEAIIKNGCDINITSLYGSPLHEAVNNLALINLLLEHGANPNIQGKHGYTPLHILCRLNHKDVIPVFQLLIKHGADMNIQSNNGCTAFHLAILMNKFDLVKEMQKIDNINYNIKNKNNESITDLLSEIA